MSKTMYVTDLDGTLLNSGDRINQVSIDIINSLVEKGMLFTYATARSLVSASVVTAGLSAKVPVIAYNGALIIHPKTEEILMSLFFTAEEAAYVREHLEKSDVSPIVYAYVDNTERVSWNTEAVNDGIDRYINNRQADRRMRPLAGKEGLYDGESFYYTCIGEYEQLLPIYELFSGDARFRCTLQQELYRPEFWCEIMPAGVSKAEAIKRLKKLWQCDRVVSFGDAVNDIPMFEISDECYAVENAVPELKAMATGIIESNDADGVAKWLLKNVK